MKFNEQKELDRNKLNNTLKALEDTSMYINLDRQFHRNKEFNFNLKEIY